MKFVDNKYTNWYNLIIKKAALKNTKETEYYEKHHIIPKSIGGTNQKNNLIKLTAREHYVCHLLLTKMTSGDDQQKMRYALFMISNVKNIGKGRYTPSSKLYEYSRLITISARTSYWTDERRAEKAKQAKANPRTFTEEQLAEYRERGKNKEWTQKAVDSRLTNCLKNSKARIGSNWTAEHRHARMDTYVSKNLEIANKIFELADTGYNKLTISKMLNISWEKVHFPLIHRAEFEARKEIQNY